MADSPLKTSLGFGFPFGEASGSRSSSYASATATEVGGTIGSTAGVDGDAVLFVRTDSRNLSLADAAANRLGQRDWTIDGFLRLDVSNQYGGLLEKGNDVSIYWAPSGAQNHLVVRLDGGALVSPDITTTITGFTYFRIEHDWSAHTVTIIVGAYSYTVSYAWANAATTSDWTFGYASGGFGAGYWGGALGNLCMWSKVLSTGEKYLRANSLKFISSWGTNPPYLIYTQAWSHFPINEAYSLQLSNYGGDATSTTTPVGTLPSGLVRTLVTGSVHVAGTVTAVETQTVTLRGTNADGSSDFQIKFVAVQHYPSAHLTFVPWQRFDAPGYLGVDAYHARLPMEKVRFVINGAAPVDVTERTLNAATGVWEFKTPLDPGDYSDGEVTVVATAYPVGGDARVLATRSINANDGGTLSPTGTRLKYVATTGNDTTGDGSSGNPYLTMKKAAVVLQAAHGDCANTKIKFKSGDFMFGWSTADTISTTEGWIELEADTGATVRFTSSGSNSLKGATFVKVRNIAGYQTNLEAPTGGAAIWVSGNCVFTGLGQIDETYVFLSNGAWTGGIYLDGDPVDWTAFGSGDVAAYKTAALTKYVRMQTTASFVFATQMKRNCYFKETSKDTTFTYDSYAANVITDDIDATGSAFHADVQHLISVAGGDQNILAHGLVATGAEGQSWFSRNGAVSQDVPDCNIVWVNWSVRKLVSGFNGQWQRSASNIGWIYCSLPNEALLLISNIEDASIRMSYVSVKQCVFAGQSLLEIGADGPAVDENHFGDSSSGTNCTTGGSETDWYDDPSADDYRPVPDSDIRDRVVTVLAPTDVLGRPRFVGGAIGAFEQSGGSLTPPILPATESSNAVPGTAVALDVEGLNSGGAGTSRSIQSIAAQTPAGWAFDGSGVVRGTMP